MLVNGDVMVDKNVRPVSALNVSPIKSFDSIKKIIHRQVMQK